VVIQLRPLRRDLVNQHPRWRRHARYTAANRSIDARTSSCGTPSAPTMYLNSSNVARRELSIVPALRTVGRPVDSSARALRVVNSRQVPLLRRRQSVEPGEGVQNDGGRLMRVAAVEQAIGYRDGTQRGQLRRVRCSGGS